MPITPVATIAQRLERQSVVPLESTIPPDVTVDQWRRARRSRPVVFGECGHLHDTTTRYDHAQKQLAFLLVCPTCGTEKVIETLSYEPRFEPLVATVHRLPVRRDRTADRRAA
jgi:hypothetical protein